MTAGGFPNATVKQWRHDLLAWHNNLRHHYKCHDLKIDTRLNTSAQNYAEKMASINSTTLTHSTLKGLVLAENIAYGQTTVKGVMKGWRDSCGHFYTIVTGALKTVGFGVAKSRTGRYYWCAHFSTKGSFSSIICSKCPCECKHGQCVGGHAFSSNDRARPGGSNYYFPSSV